MRVFATIRTAAICASLAWAAGAWCPRAAASDSPQTLSGGGGVVVLPERVVAGSRATLAVLDADGRLVPGAAVELSPGSEVTTDATGRAVFSAPAEAGELQARLRNGDAMFTAEVVSPANPSPEPDSGSAGGATPLGIVFPRLVELGNRFALVGTGFRGDAALDNVLVGGEPALVLAASPVSLVALLNPRTALGMVPLVADAGGRELGSASVSVISLDVSGPAKPLAAGEKGALTVRVNGTSERLVVAVRNLSPDVIEILRGDEARMATSGGTPNTATFEVAGVKPGEYAVSARILPGFAGLPDVEGARRELLAARQFATGQWRERLDRVLHLIEHDPQDVPRIRSEIATLLAARPPGEVTVPLQAAWNVLGER
jgi:hypothetical protein